MIAVLKGDIVASRKITNPEKWLTPLKRLLAQWGNTPEQWELVWGDFFQLEIDSPETALHKALMIKALIKKINPSDDRKKSAAIDVRIAIGIGEKTYDGQRVSESNGPAFIHAGDKFDTLKNTTLGIKSPWPDFDDEINLYLTLAGLFMDRWSVSAAELLSIVLAEQSITQQEIGALLEIKQSAVSGRWNRANGDEVLKIEQVFSTKLKQLV